MWRRRFSQRVTVQRMTQNPDQMLAEDMGRFFADPLGWVMYAFPWDSDPNIQMVRLEEPWRSRYNCTYGPDAWACEFLDELGREITRRGFDGQTPVAAIQMATSSGHGIGKSTLTAWIILFILSTRPFSKGVTTANTSEQLKTKTWGELGKWKKKCITGHWFEYNNGKGNMNVYHTEHKETWRCDGQTCREENSESFAGQHAANSTPFYIFDESSAIPDVIWDVAEGGLTDGEPMWLAFGNPTRNSGRFRECFGRFKHRWRTRQIDSRKVSITNKAKIDEWVKDYGEDSDFVRVRVKGEFPRAGSMQFIPSDIVEIARKRLPEAYRGDPCVIAVDVARFGDDESCIVVRRGRDASSIPWVVLRGVDTMTLAARIVEMAQYHKPDTIFVDEGGVGGGVVDRLRMLRQSVIGVQFGGKADRSLATESGPVVYYNKRAEMWGMMKDWLRGGAIPDDPDLAGQLTGLEYGYAMLDGKDAIQLEKKKDMKKRGLSSPDRADALALTFAYPIQPAHHILPYDKNQGAVQSNYNALGRDYVQKSMGNSAPYNRLKR